MTTGLMMRINVSPKEVDDMLFHDFKNRCVTISNMLEKANKEMT